MMPKKFRGGDFSHAVLHSTANFSCRGGDPNPTTQISFEQYGSVAGLEEKLRILAADVA